MPKPISQIQQELEAIGADIPEFIKTGVPKNVKAEKHRSLESRANTADQDILEHIIAIQERFGNLIASPGDPNEYPPAEEYGPTQFYLQLNPSTMEATALWLYTGVNSLGWWKFQNFDSDTATKYYGTISNPNEDPIPPLPETLVNEYKVGDFYIKTDNGLSNGNIENVWLYLGLAVGYPWINLTGGPGGVSMFTQLTDVPSDYAGQSGKMVVVNEDEVGLEFKEVPNIPTWGAISGTLSNQTDLQLALSGKSNIGHTHSFNDLNDKPAIPEQINLIPGPNIDITGTYPNLTIEAASGGGSSVWGSITGILSNQTDLQSALNLKANDSDVVKLSGNQTLTGVKTFSTSPVVPSKTTSATNNGTSIATEAQVFQKANDDTVVKLIGNQTISGTKSFSSFPITPSSAPTTDFQVANKKYVDDRVSAGGGAYTAGTGIDITSNVISVKQATPTERGGTKIWKGTKAAYDAIPTKDADTLYFIEDLQSAEIAVYSGMVSSLSPTVGGTIIQLDNAVVPISIWDRTYDWVLSWKDADGLHTLEDYQGSGFNTIKRIYRESSGAMRIEVLFTGTFEVPIPDNAKLTLHLSDDAPQEPKA